MIYYLAYLGHPTQARLSVFFSNVTVSNMDSPMVKFLFILFIAHVVACSSYVSEDKNTESLSVSIAKRERVSDVTLKWLNQTTMQITWPDKEIDLIHLKATKNLDGKLIIYLYIETNILYD